MKDKKFNSNSRSHNYQFKIMEIPVDNYQLSYFTNSDSLSSKLDNFQYNEDILDLQDQIKEEFWNIVKNNLTEKQQGILRLVADGYTQAEIAKITNTNQSSVSKSLAGNIFYHAKRSSTPVFYGGIYKKLRKLTDENKKIQDLFKQINELSMEKL